MLLEKMKLFFMQMCYVIRTINEKYDGESGKTKTYIGMGMVILGVLFFGKGIIFPAALVYTARNLHARGRWYGWEGIFDTSDVWTAAKDKPVHDGCSEETCGVQEEKTEK